MSKSAQTGSKDDQVSDAELVAAELSPEAVAAYLRDHPNFFSEHLDLLAQMPPSSMVRPDGVIDLRAVTVERLKSDADKLTDQFEDMIETGRTNQTLLNRTHAAVLHILESRDFETFIQAVTNDLAVVVDIDTAVLVVESDGSEQPAFNQAGLRIVDAGFIAPMISEHAVRLEGSIMGDAKIFGPSAGLVRSQALIGLSIDEDCPPCMLALGSRDPDMFHSGLRTDLLQFLARVVEIGFRRFLHWEK